MIYDNHNVTNAETGIRAAGSIADKQRLDAQFVHNSDGEGDFFHVVTFIIMETPIHCHNVLTSQFTKDKLTAVSFHGGHREVGDRTIGYA